MFLHLLAFSSEAGSRSWTTAGVLVHQPGEWKVTQSLDAPVCLTFVLDDYTGVVGWSTPVCTISSCSLMLLGICEAEQPETLRAKQGCGELVAGFV